MKESLVLFFYGLLAIYGFICICRSLFKYRVKGLSLYMLIGIQIAVLAVLGEASCLLRMYQVEKVPSPASSWKATILFDVQVVFYAIQLCFSNTVHWVFAMKYWGVAKKLQLLETNQDPDKFNKVFMRIFWVGFVLNVISGFILIGVLFAGAWINRLWNFMQLCILVSCGFLIDAFRLLSKLKSREQSISKK